MLRFFSLNAMTNQKIPKENIKLPSKNGKKKNLLRFSVDRIVNKKNTNTLNKKEQDWLDTIEFGDNDSIIENERTVKN